MKKTLLVALGFILIGINSLQARPTSVFSPVLAENIYVRDLANNFTYRTVEDVLAELYGTSLSTNAAVGLYLLLDGSNANQDIDVRPYDIHVGSITGYGGGLTGISSVHSDLSNLNWAAADHTFDSNLDIGNYSFIGTSITVDSGIPAEQYDVVIGTVAGNGVDFYSTSYSSYTQQKMFQDAIDTMVSGQTLYAKSGTYVFNSSFTSTINNIKILTDNATIEVDASRTVVASVDASTLFKIEGDDTMIRGFTFNGNNKGVNCINIGTTVRIKLHDLTFIDCGASDNNNFQAINVGFSLDGEAINLTFENCDGGQIIDFGGSYWRFVNIFAANSSGKMEFRGGHNQISNLTLNACDYLSINSDNNLINGFVITNPIAQAVLTAGGADFNSFTNGVITEGGTSFAVYLNGNTTTMSNVAFENIHNTSAVYIAGDGNAVSNLTFSGVIDDYCIRIPAGALDNTISNCVSKDVTGNLGFLLDESGNDTNQYYGNIPDDASYADKLLNNTTFYADLTVNGILYWNTASVELFATDNTLFSTHTADVSVFQEVRAVLTMHDDHGFTISGSSMTYTGFDGIPKHFFVVANYTWASDTINSEIHMFGYINGEKHDSLHQEAKAAGVGDIAPLVISGRLHLDPGDTLQFRVSSDKNCELTARHTNISIFQTD